MTVDANAPVAGAELPGGRQPVAGRVAGWTSAGRGGGAVDSTVAGSGTVGTVEAERFGTRLTYVSVQQLVWKIRGCHAVVCSLV